VKKLLFIILAMIVSTSILIGCTKDTTTTAATTAATSAATSVTTTAPATTAEVSKYGGVFKTRSANPLDQPFGDPLMYGPGSEGMDVVLETLLSEGDAPGVQEYALATGCKLAPDKSYYDISLRQGVQFHDGTPFNAEAVKWNLDRARSGPVALLTQVESIEVIDDYTIRLNLTSWDNQILYDLEQGQCFMISPTNYEKNTPDWANFHPAGTGPFVFKENRSNQILVFEKDPNYWGKDDQGNQLPYLDGFEVHYIPDMMVAQAALESGEIDLTGPVDKAIVEKVMSDPNYQVLPWTLYSGPAFYMNTEDPDSVWSDQRVRQALEYAIDKETTVQTLGNPLYQPRYNIINGLELAVPDEGIVPRKYDTAKAKQLLQEAGHASVEFDLYVVQIFWGMNQEIILTWQEQMAAAGFIANIQVIEVAKWIEMGMSPLPDNAVSVGIVVGGSKSNPMYTVPRYYQAGGLSFVGVKRPAEWDTLLPQALQTEDISQMISLLVEVDKVAYDQAMIIPLFLPNAADAANNRVHDFERHTIGTTLRITWLTK